MTVAEGLRRSGRWSPKAPQAAKGVPRPVLPAIGPRTPRSPFRHANGAALLPTPRAWIVRGALKARSALVPRPYLRDLSVRAAPSRPQARSPVSPSEQLRPSVVQSERPLGSTAGGGTASAELVATVVEAPWATLGNAFLSESGSPGWIYHAQVVAETVSDEALAEEGEEDQWYAVPLLVAGSHAARGNQKPDMQDRHVKIPNIADLAALHMQSEPGLAAVDVVDVAASLAALPSSLAAVFDGHGGSQASRYSASNLRAALLDRPELWHALSHAWLPKMEDSDVQNVKDGLRAAYAALDAAILKRSEFKPPGEVDGTTALVGLQVGQHLFVANLGDSRAVLSRGGIAVRMSEDHTPDVPTERQRIEAEGGVVRMHRGVWRLWLQTSNGYAVKISSVSRALGDIDYKRPRALMSGVPDVQHWILHPRYDRFAIYASDGVWGVMSDQQAVDEAANALAEARSRGLDTQASAEAAARAVVARALEMGSYDDVTAVVTVFNWQADA